MTTQASARIHLHAAVPQFSVPDLIRTVAYYRDVLGFRVLGFWSGDQVTAAPDSNSVFSIIERDEVQVFFSRGEGTPVRAESENYDVYVRMSGVDPLARELRGRGAEILDGPADRVYGQRELVVRDCNGIVLVFGETLSSLRP